jgi:anti-sigma factor RsiW
MATDADGKLVRAIALQDEASKGGPVGSSRFTLSSEQPVPWLARPVLDFLYQLDLSNARVFEYGGGASTWYWARR